ncbi:protein kinase domain-containing protein [Candidatus Uabimicrobium amorphum]|uniref:Serine/threonine-protein kinase PknH n=1 Tax=Uabimicrobium amorphum TaxID=2596890 RepID=A0A5S9ISK9_UABAM|nr:protein kinase [Candidatus Uabimicrobium amorphum]BBM87164.1 serine/threonine-protein kinase PknH [Candidatus Uabimicrobium amorphum]
MNKKIGPYSIVRFLGEGGMGKVYEAYNPTLQIKAAIKIMHGTTKQELLRIQAEARAIAALTHPNIPRLYDFGEHDGCVYIAMEYIAGTTLSSLLQQKKFSVRKAIHITKTLASVLHYMHSKGIVHRDLKPSNVMVTKEQKLYIMDFGLAQKVSSYERITQTGHLVGTLAYIPPEHFYSQRPSVSEKGDIYSLGIIFYELLTNNKPFRASSTAYMVNQIISGNLSVPSKINAKVSAEVDRIFCKATHKTPEKRFSSMVSFARGLAKCNSRTTKKEPKTKIAAMVFAVVGIFVIGMVFFRSPTTKKNSAPPKAKISTLFEKLLMSIEKQQPWSNNFKQIKKMTSKNFKRITHQSVEHSQRRLIFKDLLAKVHVSNPKSLSLQKKDWQSYRNAIDAYPPFNKESGPFIHGEQIILNEGNLYQYAAAFFYKRPISQPFVLEFDYNISLTMSEKPCDGFAFMFNKKLPPFGVLPPQGAFGGFIFDGSGYGVLFKTFEPSQNVISVAVDQGNYTQNSFEKIQDVEIPATVWINAHSKRPGTINEFVSYPTKVFENNRWKKVRIFVMDKVIALYLDNKEIVFVEESIDFSSNFIGFSCATGALAAKHKIRNIKFLW